MVTAGVDLQDARLRRGLVVGRRGPLGAPVALGCDEELRPCDRPRIPEASRPWNSVGADSATTPSTPSRLAYFTDAVPPMLAPIRKIPFAPRPSRKSTAPSTSRSSLEISRSPPEGA